MRPFFLFLACAACGGGGSAMPGSSTDAGDAGQPGDAGDADLAPDQAADVVLPPPTTLVAKVKSPCCLAADATNLYYGTDSGATIWSVPIAGGAPTMLAGSFVNAVTIAVGADALYVLVGTGAIAKVSLPGGGWSPLLQGAGLPGIGLVLVGSTLYWTTSSAGNVMKIDVGGGMAMPVATNQMMPVAIAGDSTGLYWANGTGMNGSIVGMTLPSGAPTPVTTVMFPWTVAVDATNVYFHENTDTSSLWKVPRSGGAATKLFGPQMGLPLGEWVTWLAPDGSSVFVATGNGGHIFEVDPSSGKGTLVVTDGPVTDVLADATNLYWISQDPMLGYGNIRKSPKP
jgi:hypothetical protein